ncbi:hypothetical protein KUCAC02_013334 [Chaenocephalus aceratus]|nr:hypothetical protein KUCAC02_013334 [Chaenocephalus aceratus]
MPTAVIDNLDSQSEPRTGCRAGIRIEPVCVAEDKVGYIKSRLVSGQIVPRSDLTAYRSYCVTALLIRHKLSKEAVVEFQVHDWLHRTTGNDGTTIRLTSSKAAGHTFTLSQQEDEVGLKPTKGLTSGQGRFFVDCGGNPLTNIYSDLQRLRKKYLPQEPGAVVDETPSSSESPSTGPASLPTPPVTVGIQWDRFLEAFPVSLHSVAPSKRLCVGAGFTAYRPLYRKWRNVQLLERTSYILSQAMGRHATQPTEEAVRRSLTKERWVSNTPSVQDVVRGWVAPLGVPTSSQSLIRSISEQSWRGLAVRDFGGERAKELCIDASSRCDCHPEVETYGRFLNHSRKRPNLKSKRQKQSSRNRRRPSNVFPVAGKTSPTPPRPSGSGRVNTMRHITLPPSMEAVMTEYRDYNAGIDPDTKLSENVQSKVSRVKQVLLFMGRDSPRLSDWLFLKDTSKIRAWPHDLRENSNLAVTTVAFYIKNILQFMWYLMDSHVNANWLSRSDMHTIVQELQGSLVCLHREVTVHQFHVKRRKLDSLPSYGLQGSISHTLLRTALADTVKRYQDPSNREVLSRFMCHDLRTANRYYACNPGVKEALGIRYMFQQSFAQATMDAEAGI